MRNILQKNAMLVLACTFVALFIGWAVYIGLKTEGISKEQLPSIGVPPSYTKESGHLVSIEALDTLVNNGYKRVFVVLNFTRDNKLVCISNWKNDVSSIFPSENTDASTKAARMTYADFTTLPVSSVRPCTLETLTAWLKDKNDVSLVIKLAKNPSKGFAAIAKEIPNAQKQVIPLVDNASNYKKIKDLKYNNIIISLPKNQPISNNNKARKAIKDFNKLVETQRNITVHMPAMAIKRQEIAKKILKKEVPVYLTVSNCAKYSKVFAKGKTGIFADPLLTAPCEETSK